MLLACQAYLSVKLSLLQLAHGETLSLPEPQYPPLENDVNSSSRCCEGKIRVGE